LLTKHNYWSRDKLIIVQFSFALKSNGLLSGESQSPKNPAYAVKSDDSKNERQDNILPML
jgi:hypothetical protein